MKTELFSTGEVAAVTFPLDGLVIDNFAGGGGASTGIEQALGRKIDIAINHDPEAVAMHRANHPDTLHYCQSVWQADPVEVVTDPSTGKMRPVSLAWFSPDCKHFSKAKGGKPRAKNIRDLAWVVVLWAERVRPAVIMLENVEEFQGWGPLDEHGQPIRDRAGETFRKWTAALKKLGYKIEWRELRACDYGAPTSRKRFFMIARCDGRPIVWPEPTHGKPGSAEVLSGQRLPWRTAAEIIDWSIPCPSIFERSRPLKDATCRRIAAGIIKFVLNNPRPFIVPVTNTNWAGNRAWDSEEPLRTITTAKGGEMAMVSPFMQPLTHQGNDSRVYGPEQPLPTVTAANRGEVALVSPTFVGCGGRRGQSGPVDPEAPFPTITAKADAVLVAPTMVQTGYGEREGQAPRALNIEAPLGTIVGTGKHAAVAAFIHKYRPHSPGSAMDAPLPTVTANSFIKRPGGAPPLAVAIAHLAQHNTMPAGGIHPGRSAEEPVSTVTASGAQQQVVTSNLVKLQNNQDGKPVDAPLETVLAHGLHYGEVRAFLTKYYGNEEGGHNLYAPLGAVTTKDRFGVVTVTVDGQEYAIADIGMRMLSARELFSAQSFPPGYDIDCAAANGGKPLTKTSQVAKCGNSVPPVMSEALVRANFPRMAA
ncbi:MAG: DNA cytosine methyltransferase [Sphingobium sp.]